MQDLINFVSHHPMEIYALAFLLVSLMIVEYFRLKRNNFSINTTQAVQLINHEHAVIIDLRPKDTYRTGHIIDSHSLPSGEIAENPKKIEKFRTKPIVVVCASGQESQKIAAFWAKKGYNIYSLSGGLRSWTDSGLPLIKE